MNRLEEMENRIRELETKLRELERTELAIEAAGVDIWENNFVTGETHGTNRRCFLSLGYGEDELPKNLAETFNLIHPNDFQDGMQKVKAHFAGETARYQSEMRTKAKDGSWVWFINLGRVVERDEDGNVTRFMGITLDVDQRHLLEEQFRAWAYTDSLTGLNNRRGFTEAGAIEIERAVRYGHPLSLLMFDIDHFKNVNDSFGHQAGDEVLQGVTDCVNATLRQIDLKARWGGDEFIALLVETGLDEATQIAERLRGIVEETGFQLAEHVTLSIGIATMEKGDNLESMIRRADNALYRAKHSGRNRINFLTDPSV